MLKTILLIVLVAISIILTVIILMQEGKSAGLGGTIEGVADTYWGKIKGHSMEGRLKKATRIMILVFFVLSMLLSMSFLD